MGPSSRNKTGSEALQGDLHTARVVVTVGRGVKDQACFDLIVRFAEAVGAQIAATRGAVEMGWLPKERELGLSGIRVTPELYVGCGVAGANFHTVGMEHAGTIVGINTDPRARIFELADVGIVADVGECIRWSLEHLPSGPPPTAWQTAALFAAYPGAVIINPQRKGAGI